jgi:hypothetical protein
MEKIRWSTILLLSVVACGGQASNVDGASGDNGAGSGSGSGSTSGSPTIVGSGSTAPSSGVTAATTGDTTAPGGGTTGAAGGGSGAGGGNGAPADAGPARVLPPITATMCGTATCTATQECCIELATGKVACDTACTGASIAATCSSAASCTGGQVCCASLDIVGGGRRDGGGPSASCQDSCAREDAGRGAAAEVQLCATDDECPAGDTCRDEGGGLVVCAPAPVVRDAGVRLPFDAGIFRIPDGGFEFDAGRFEFDAGERRMRDAAARD